MTFGYPMLAALTALSVVAALAVALRARCRGRAELLLATTLIWNFLIICPIYALGLTNHLYRRTLASSSAGFFVAVLGLSFLGRDPRAFARALRDAALGLLRLPQDAFLLAIRRRSLVFFGLVLATIAVVWTTIMSWYVPSWGQWDSLWYHEPMIGFAIQNHGFAFVDLPADVQKINGFPRLVEMTQLWFVIFTDRRLVEVLNSLLSPALVASVYLLCSRYTKNRVHAMGWGTALLLTPLVSNLLQTMYVDVASAIYVLGATYWATEEELRFEDAMLAIVCLTLAIGSKLMAIVPVGVLSVMALTRLVGEHGRARPWKTLGVSLWGLASIGGMAASCFWRNYRKFHNPLWPDFKYDNDKWNIHWPGSLDWAKGGGSGTLGKVSMNIPMPRLLEDLYAIPYSKTGSYYYQDFDYGFTLAWLILPLSIIGLSVAFVAVLGSYWHRAWGSSPFRARPETHNLLLVSVPAIAILVTSPALWSARYNIAAVGIMMAVVAWIGGRASFDRLGEGAVATSTLAAIVMFFWAQPRWIYTPIELGKLMDIPYPAREFTTQPQISSTLWLARGSAINQNIGLLREAELGPGDIVAFPDEYGGFPALFWNNRYTNSIVYLPTAQLIEGAEKIGAKWVYCHYSDYNISRLRGPGSGWQEIGTFNVEGWGAAFRRAK